MYSVVRQIGVVLLVGVVASAMWLVPAQAATPGERYADAAFRATNAQRVDHDDRRSRRLPTRGHARNLTQRGRSCR